MQRLLMAALLALGLAVVPVSESAAVVQNVRAPIDVTFVNPCTADTIEFTGTIHLLAGEASDGSGGFHLHIDDNVSGVTGVGVPSGTVYHGVGGDWFEANVRPPFPVVLTATDVFGLISVGASSNLVANATFHITVNPDGTVTAQVMRMSFNCR